MAEGTPVHYRNLVLYFAGHPFFPILLDYHVQEREMA